jgi:hypothetical protein
MIQVMASPQLSMNIKLDALHFIYNMVTVHQVCTLAPIYTLCALNTSSLPLSFPFNSRQESKQSIASAYLHCGSF